MNEFLATLSQALGGIEQVKTLDAGTHTAQLAAGLWEVRPFNGWAYFREGDRIIELDSDDLPIAVTDAVIVHPEQTTHINVRRSGEWSFLVETGGVCQLILRSLA